MALSPGMRLGPYEIVALLGSGGMGDVYRARDTKLNRAVAIKLLSDELADTAARRRFQNEAQTASSLNHPHILTVYEAGEFDGRQYLATEFVDGGTLGEWARAEQLSWRQVIQVLIGVADGLAAAHQAGILHRDVKPANILISKNGYAKLADFGLAKLCEDVVAGADDQTRASTAPATKAGVIVGTVAYMSPEQAAGKPLDPRSDVFSFGVVLYELLAGRRPFVARTDLELLQTIINRPAEPLPATLPVGLRMAVDKALEKDPADRYQTMRDLVVDLRRVARTAIAPEEPAPVAASPSWWWIAAALVGALAAGVALGPSVVERVRPGWRNPLDGATFTRLTDFDSVEADAVISPDGSFVAFISDRDGPLDVWLLQIGSGQFKNLTEGKVPNLFSSQVRGIGFTPDGSHVTLQTSRPNPDRPPTLSTSAVPTIGGPIRLLMENRIDPQWSPDGTQLLFLSLLQNRDVMFVAGRDGSDPREVFEVAGGEHNHFLAWSSDGRSVFSSRSARSVQETDIWRAPAGGGAPERLTHHNGWTAYPLSLDERTLLYIASDANNAGIWLYAMDLTTREEHRLSVGIQQYTSIAAAAPRAGRPRQLVATISSPVGSLWSMPIGPSVAPESAASVFSVPSAQVSSPRFGPDYLLYLSSRELADGLWKLQDGAATELWKSRDGAVLAAPAVSRDGRQIAVSVMKERRARLYVITSDGANPQPLAPSLEVREAASWSPDGKALAVTGYDDTGPGLFRVPVDGGAPVRLYDKLCYLPAWSPDGRYILFGEYVQGPTMQARAVTPDGQPVDLPVIRFTRPGTRIMASAYRFLPDGKSLVLLEGEWRKPQFWLVSLETGARRLLTDLRPGRATRSFDVTPDGKSILFDRVQDNADIVLIELPVRQD